MLAQDGILLRSQACTPLRIGKMYFKCVGFCDRRRSERPMQARGRAGGSYNCKRFSSVHTPITVHVQQTIAAAL